MTLIVHIKITTSTLFCCSAPIHFLSTSISCNRATGVAKQRKCTLAFIAFLAMIKETNAAVRAKINSGIFEVNRPLTTRANILGEAGQRRIVTKLLAPFDIGQGFVQFLPLKIAIE